MDNKDVDREPLAPGGLAPFVPVMVAIGYLVLAYAAVLLVDVAAVGGTRGWIREAGGARPSLWIMLFEDGSPTELLQWSAIGAVAVLAGIETGRSRALGELDTSRGWALIGVAAIMMLMEDAGNVRHRIVHYYDAFIGLPGGAPWHLAIEAVWFVTIVGVFVAALVLGAWRALGRAPVVRWAALGGAACYGLAVLGSATRDIGWWYADAGRWIEESLLRTRLLVPDGWSRGQVHFFLMDYMVEESLELLGASLLLTAVLCYRRWGRTGT